MDIAGGLLWYVAFLFSTTLHEAAHAYVAWRGGDETAYRGGQVTLSPLPHIKREPIGMVVVPLLTALTQGWAMGWASTPFSPYWATHHPRRAAMMAAAGPLANLSIALAAFLALKVGLGAGLFVPPEHASIAHMAASPNAALQLAARILSILLMLNVFLCVFNFLPLPPLDGASAAGLLLPGSLASDLQALLLNRSFSFLGLLVAWQVFPLVASPLFGIVLGLLHPGAGYH